MSKSLGKRIRTFRMQNHLTQTQLAEKICSPSMISQIESGRAKPSYKILAKLAERLEVPLSNLLSEVELHLEEMSTYKMACAMVAAKEFALAIPQLKLLHESPKQKVSSVEVLLLLGECYFNQTELEEAESVFHQVLEYAIPRKDSHLHALVLENIGRIEYKRTRFQVAEHSWKTAISELEKTDVFDIRLKGRLLTSIANAQMKLGLVQDAVSHYEQSLSIYESVSNLQELGRTYLALAQSCQTINDFKRSVQYSERAIAAYEMLDDRHEKSKLLAACAVVYGGVGREEEAIRMLEAAVRKFQALDLREEMAVSCIELGKLRLKTGDIEKAEESCLIARALLPELHTYQAWVNCVLGKVAKAKGEFKDAMILFNRAACCLKTAGETAEWENTMHELSDLYKRMNEPERALEVLEEMRCGIQQVMQKRGIVL